MNRKKIILILIFLLIVILVAVYFLFLKPKSINQSQVYTPPSEESAENNQQSTTSNQQSAPPSSETATPEEAEHGQVKNLALSFAERFGSFSNQANYQNLIELKPQMTSQMVAWTDNFIALSPPPEALYYSQITKALSFKENFYDAASGEAEYLVICERQETKATAAPRVYYQNIKIILKKQSGAWLVDSADWQ